MRRIRTDPTPLIRMQFTIRRIEQASSSVLRVSSEILIRRSSEVFVHLSIRSKGTVEVKRAIGTRRRESNRPEPVFVPKALSSRGCEECLPAWERNVGTDERLAVHNRCFANWTVKNLPVGSARVLLNHSSECVVGQARARCAADRLIGSSVD